MSTDTRQYFGVQKVKNREDLGKESELVIVTVILTY